MATLATDSASAGLVFKFVQRGSNDVIATMELSDYPADHTKVMMFSFSSVGDKIFGLGVGPAEHSMFSSTAGSVKMDPNGGLHSSTTTRASFSGKALAIDFSTTLPGSETGPFLGSRSQMAPYHGSRGQASTSMAGLSDQANVDKLMLLNGSRAQITEGDWLTSVPEPSGLILWSAAMGVTMLRRRRNSAL